MRYKDKHQPDRRGFLSLVSNGLLYLSGLLGLSGVLRYLSYEDPHAEVSRYELGSAEAYPVGSRTIIPEALAILLHTTEGFEAISLVCTHLGCLVNSTPEGFACPCHGSRFDPDGRYINGPANEPLRRLTVETRSDGSIVIIQN